jgi:hypothetical protein
MALTQVFTAGEKLTAAKLNASSIPVVSSTTDITTPYTGQLIFLTTGNQLYRYTGAAWTLYDPNVQHIPKSATESVTSSTTLQNDDHFVFSMQANAKYEMEAFLFYDGAADPAGGLKMSFTGPASSSMTWCNFGANQGAPSSYNVVVEGIAAAGRVVATNGATVMSCRPAGTVTTAGTAGNLQFQWAQGTSNVTATRILADSWMRLTRVA